LGRCWIWAASIDGRGYGQFSITPGHNVRAHRFSFELSGGVLDDDLHIDHLCVVPLCVNPDHLEQVTPLENQRRAHRARVMTTLAESMQRHPSAA